MKIFKKKNSTAPEKFFASVYDVRVINVEGKKFVFLTAHQPYSVKRSPRTLTTYPMKPALKIFRWNFSRSRQKSLSLRSANGKKNVWKKRPTSCLRQFTIRDNDLKTSEGKKIYDFCITVEWKASDSVFIQVALSPFMRIEPSDRYYRNIKASLPIFSDIDDTQFFDTIYITSHYQLTAAPFKLLYIVENLSLLAR